MTLTLFLCFCIVPSHCLAYRCLLVDILCLPLFPVTRSAFPGDLAHTLTVFRVACIGNFAASPAQSAMEEGNRCRTCSLINVRKRTVVCAMCSGTFHLSCVGLTRTQADAIPRWSCLPCLGRGDEMIAPEPEVEVDLAEYITLCRSSARVLKIIPKGAVMSVAEALHELIDQAVREKSRLAWGKLLSFGYGAISQPAFDLADGAERSVSLATRVKRQVTSFMGASRLPVPEARGARSRGNQQSKDQRLRASVSAKFGDGDIKGAVRLLASSEDIAPQDDNTFAALQQKHPPVPVDLSLPASPDGDYPTPTMASAEDIRRALASFRPGSAGGPDGLRPSHLSALISRKSAEAGARLLTSLTELVNLVLRGEVPEFARNVFYGATLCALGKKDGGIRPIAVGSTFRRLATKVGARPLAVGIGDHLRPVQLGFSSRGGCEAAAHAARKYLQGAQHRRVIFKVDMANAFNSMRRDVFLAAARERAQGLYRLLWQAYSDPTTLFYGDRSLVSATGIQQGDPFGPALFSLGIDDLARELDAEFNVWYLDDGTIGDTPEKALVCARKLIAGLAGLGLNVNQNKCELVILNHTGEEAQRTEESFRELLPEIKIVSASESSLLGAPLTEFGISEVLSTKREDLERMVARLQLIENHQAFALLKNCFALPKLQYILRASPAYNHEGELDGFDETLVSALSAVTNVRFDGDSRVQSALPVRLGGLGIRMSKDIALPAFISSLRSTHDLVEAILHRVNLVADVESERAVEVWIEKAGCALAAGADEGRQRTWDVPLAEISATRLLERADQISRARLMASACRESGLWLNALPSPAIGTLLDSETLRIAVSLRVGAEVCEPHTCRCGRMMDARGLHGLSCKYSAGRHPRHAALNDVVKRALQGAGIPSILEPVGIDRGDGKRPDGISVFPFTNGRCLCWDATCVDTYAVSHVNSSAVAPGNAAREAEERKRRKYAALGARYRFEPVAVETAGVYGDTTGTLLSEIGRRLVEATGERREASWLEQRIGLAVQRGNACSILTAVRDRHEVSRARADSRAPPQPIATGRG